MRGLLRIVLASKAEHLDIEAARLENLLRDMDAAEERDARSVHELEAEQERLSARTYELDAELRQTAQLFWDKRRSISTAPKIASHSIANSWRSSIRVPPASRLKSNKPNGRLPSFSRG